MSIKDLINSAKNAVFEEEPGVPEKAQAIKKSAPDKNSIVVPTTDGVYNGAVGMSGLGLTITSLPNSETNIIPENNSYYQNLKAAVGFESTDVYKIINKYLSAMSTAAVDEKTKFSLAWSQAQALDHLTKDQVVATLNGLSDSLDIKIKDFNAWLQQQNDRLVTPKEQKIEELTKQMQDISSQIQQLGQEKAEALSKITLANSQFQSAAALTRAEAQTQQQKYLAFLG